ncbi:E3 ubiquitin-protein ligase TTC3 isoform X3 [Frankliniella occidentalis]|uniref:E3 ubiquitin-protein ligase TTC3 isoform X3 n=1 Tax=Frankliniella occidentalis TaxID=133901 RepID=A0A6J1SBI7_FRAOC|nr:E3 ubiquitin-protein ligase TTC3 isoform X3 [Frankliniella occidentalis]
MADTSCSDSDLDRHAGSKNVKDDQRELLTAGSTALLNNSPQDAVSNYSSVLEKIPFKSSLKMPIAQVILRYSLCVALIKCNDYQNIADAAEYLMELIDSGYASKFPALYLALARAFYSLNRFKKALEIAEKGLKSIQNMSKVKHHSWPGLQQVIEETSKDFLHKELLALQKDCKNIKPPDALCLYDKCLEYSSHIVPAREIYFSDPDFKPFILLQCGAKCQFAYHNSCWEHLKHVNSYLEEPKDLLDMPCLSEKCSSDKDNGSVIVETQLIGPEGFKKPLMTCHSLPGNTSNSTPVSQSGSSSKAKSKVSHFKDEQSSREPLLLSPSIINTFCSSEEDLTCETLNSSKCDTILEILKRCRSMKFGYSDEEYMNPELQCFGHPFAEFSSYVGPNEIDDDDTVQAEFVFSYYQSVFDKNGHDRIEDLQEKWKTTINNDLGLPETFTDKYSSVSEFLLRSERFAAIDDIIGTSDLLPDMFSNAETEITQSVSYLLFSRQVSHTHKEDKQFSTDSFNDAWRTKINNNNCDTNSQLSSSLSAYVDCTSDRSREDSDLYYRSESDVSISDKDSNDNPVSVTSKTSCMNSNVNGELKPTSEPFVPQSSSISKSDVVYMSDDDEEIDHSLVDLPEERSACQGESDVMSSLAAQKWSEGINKVDTAEKDSQTEDVLDPEKVSLIKENQSLKKHLSGLAYEKDELHQRIESLQVQMENAQATQESEHEKTLQKVQKELDLKINCKDKEIMEIEKKCSGLEQDSKRYQEIVEEHEKKIADLEAMMDQTRRRHAKEINNFEKRLQVEKLNKEQEFIQLLKNKDQMYIQLWKEFCDFKFKKFRQACNDKINVLLKLQDIMSDTVRPTKAEIKSAIDSIEDDMIAHSQKNSDVNSIFNQELENLKNGKDIQLPSVVEVPDTPINLQYEGAFDYIKSLLKPKQEDYAMSRNYPVSKFYPSRPFASNGLQALSQTREAEGFPAMPPSSLFGQPQNETSNLWNNTYPTPNPIHSALPFDVGSTNGTHIPLPTFGASSMITPQPQLSTLMPQMMSYQQSSSQNPSVQSMIGQSRSTPSPLPFPSMNGSAFNQNLSAAGAIGSKQSAQGSFPKPVSAPNTTAVKSPTPVPSAAPPAAAQQAQSLLVQQGAIPKPRVQTATASMTPIVPTKPQVRPLVKGTKSESNYEKLMRNLQKMFPNRNDMELTQALKMARYRNGNTLSSLTHSDIVGKVQEILNKQSKQTSMGWEKFGQAAWGTAKAPIVEWEGGDQDECCICMTSMSAKEVYSLECKHSFHKDCIRKWLLQDSVCPNCRTHSTMLDEFPPLG